MDVHAQSPRQEPETKELLEEELDDDAVGNVGGFDRTKYSCL